MRSSLLVVVDEADETDTAIMKCNQVPNKT